MNKARISKISAALLAAGLIGLPAAASAAATIVILNADPAGVGFNDPTPAAPVGGNTGTTIGQQRLNAYQHVAAIWGSQLDSATPITVKATWEALNCSSTSATLGSAGANSVWRDFSGAPLADTWYSAALANKLHGSDLDTAADDPGDDHEITARFNINLGKPGCLDGAPFYLGLDGNVPAGQVDFIEVLLHEVGHGLGFQALTSGASGARISDGTPHPAVWERFMFDNTKGKSWFDMTDAERAASALNSRRLAWTGANVAAGAPSVLSKGTPRLVISSSSSPSANGTYEVGSASFGPQLGTPGLQGEVMPVVDQPDGKTGLACDPLNAINALAVKSHIGLVDRGGCTFAVKVKNLQNAGALGVLVADNAAGSPPAGLGGADDTITIPAVRISLDDGTKLKAALKTRSRTRSGVFADLGVNASQMAGADPAGRVLLFTPNPYQPGSSVSHWDTIAFPNLLMEPSINVGLTQSVKPPQDLTLPLLKDIGW